METNGEFSDDKNICNFPVFQQPIPSFGPGEELFILLSQGFNLDKKNGEKILTPYEFNIDTQYEFAGKVFKHRHEINLHAYLMTSQDRSELLDELEKIRNALERKQPYGLRRTRIGAPRRPGTGSALSPPLASVHTDTFEES